MPEEQLLAILKLDWSRLRRGFATIGAAMALACAVLAATGRFNFENVVIFGMGLSIGPLFSIGALGIRDRMEGTLALFAGLPIRASRLAILRLASLAILVLPVALVDGVLVGIALPGAGAPATAAVGIALAVWIFLGSAAIWLAAVSIAIPPDRASLAFGAGFLVFLGAMTALERVTPTPAGLLRLLLDPANAWIFPIVLAGIAVASAAGAWALTAWGIRNYTTEAERPG